MSLEKNNINCSNDYNAEIALGLSAFFGLLALILLIVPFFSMAWLLTVTATVIAILFLSMAVIFLINPMHIASDGKELTE